MYSIPVPKFEYLIQGLTDRLLACRRYSEVFGFPTEWQNPNEILFTMFRTRILIPDWIRIQMSQQIWSRMGNPNPVPNPRKAKFVPKKGEKKLRNFMFEDLPSSGAGMSLVGL
jgi:hypothetical protein